MQNIQLQLAYTMANVHRSSSNDVQHVLVARCLEDPLTKVATYMLLPTGIFIIDTPDLLVTVLASMSPPTSFLKSLLTWLGAELSHNVSDL